MEDLNEHESENLNRDSELGLRKKPSRKVPAFVEGPDFRFDYKNVHQLRFFISDRGKILPQRMTGLTAKQQRDLKRAVRRARHLALIPYTSVD